MRRLVRFVLVIGVAGAFLAGALGALVIPYREVDGKLYTSTASKLGSLTELDEPSVVYDKDGAVMAVLKAEENRKPVTLSEGPAIVKEAVLDVEDANFYGHSGFDVRSTARAFFTNAGAGAIRQGGSTITQQLVKKTLLSSERSVDRKIKEAVLATRLEKEMTKDEILERYLNLVYFGNGAYGVGAAAETYFNVPVGQLGPGEAALLAGLIRNPLANDPFKNPDQARERRATALDQMVQNKHLSEAEAEVLKASPLPTAPNKPAERQSYFMEALKRQLLADPRLGDTAPDRYDAIFRGGLKIHTTFDPQAQQLAEQATSQGLPPVGSRGNRVGATSALVTVDAATGYVRAVVGGPGFSDENKFDIATQGYRQPGSTFKMFTLLAALEAGYGPGSTVDGSGPCIAAEGVAKGRKRSAVNADYVINNAGDTIGGGTMTMQAATAGSVNCAFERMAATIGFEKVGEMARRLGVGLDPRFPIVPPYPATLPIGVKEATPLEMAAAYAAVADDGIYHAPSFVDRVEDRSGKAIIKGPEEGKRVISTTVARTAAQIMKGVFSGTAACCRLKANQPAAGKTGTTDLSKNTWFIGYTPTTVTAVWVGVPRGNVSMRGLGGHGTVFGATYAAPIWKAFMDQYLAGKPAPDFPGVPPKQGIGSKPFKLPAGAPILGGSGGSATSVKGGAKVGPTATPKKAGPTTTGGGGSPSSTSKPPPSSTPTSSKPTTTAP
jgi:penicillin-binding protein 1A